MGADLSEQAIRESLRGEWGRTMRFYEEVGSTSSEALEWTEAGGPEGAVVVADHQTAGRGRRGRSWASAPGSALQFSVILRPAGGIEGGSLLSTMAGLACAEAVEASTGLPTLIKWPNDVTVDGRKLAGILVEARLEGAEVRSAVVGIGINCHWEESDMPAEIAHHATSIDIERRRRGSDAGCRRSELLGVTLRCLEDDYRLLTNAGGPAQIVERAAARSEIVGCAVRVRLAEGRIVEGRAAGLAESGGLVVETGGGEVVLEVGEIERVRTE